MKLISINSNHSGCDYHRIKLPISYLHQDGLISGVQSGDIKDMLQQADVVMFNRIPTGISMQEVLAFRDLFGFKLIVDIDDYWQLYPGHHAEREWHAGKYAEQIIDNIRTADAVFCTGNRLKDRITAINPNVYVIPNGLPYGDLQFTAERMPSPDGKPRFIYVGGGSHQHDIALLKGPIAGLARYNFDNEVILGGIYPDVPIYQSMIRSMSASSKLRRFSWMYPRPLDSYMDLYNAADVALAPLVANTFNSHKSNLKVLEAAAKAMPIIVSNTGPYYDDPNPLTLRASSPGEWIRWFKYCAANPAFVEDNGAAMLDYAKHYYHIRIMNDLRMEAFENVMKNGKRQGTTTIHGPGL